MAKSRAELAYEKALEIYDVRKEVTDARERLKDASDALERLEDEHEALVNGDVTTVAKPAKRKPTAERTQGATKQDNDDATGVFANIGSLDDVKASIINLLRGEAGRKLSAGYIAKSLDIDGAIASKALTKMTGLQTEGAKRGKKYWVIPEIEDANNYDESSAEHSDE